MEERNRPSPEDFIKPTDEYSKFKKNRYSLNQFIKQQNQQIQTLTFEK